MTRNVAAVTLAVACLYLAGLVVAAVRARHARRRGGLIDLTPLALERLRDAEGRRWARRAHELATDLLAAARRARS